MVDIQVIRDDPELVKEKSKQKGYEVDIDKLLSLDEERKQLLSQVDTLRQKRNEIAGRMRGGKPSEADINEGKQVKVQLAEREELLDKTESEWLDLLKMVPNPAADDVPVGDEDKSIEVGSFGDKSSGAMDHLDLAEKKDWVDFERGSKVAGAKFYYLKGDLALLENALTQYALDFIAKKGFTFMTVPHLVSSQVMNGAGFSPRTSDQSDEYFIDGEDLGLIATAEIPLTGYHKDEIIDEEKLPLKYVALSPCYRKEAGAYGKHARGLFRVHQFNKLEMYAFTTPERSQQMHEDMRKIEEELWQSIGIPYHVINTASGDLGAPAVKKYDIEYWSKVDSQYRELTSCSNCTDYQARNLNIRVRREDGRVEALHTLNGTAVALARSLIAIIEHFQIENGDLRIPEVLKPYMGNRDTI